MAAAALEPDARALHVLNVIDTAYTGHLGRWASRHDLAARTPPLLKGEATEEALVRELLASRERRDAVSRAPPASASAAALAAARA